MRRIGVLMSLAADASESSARLTAFVQGLQQLGWTDGRSVRIDTRWAAGDADRGRRYAAELVALAPDVILASGGSVAGRLLQVTRTVPIVFDPLSALGQKWKGLSEQIISALPLKRISHFAYG
jgi:putative tryptophan/tyrosine transport system substrate-binding protein